MKNNINIWKLISLIFFIILISLCYSNYSKKSSEIISVTQTPITNPQTSTEPNATFKTDNVSDGENLYNIGSILRIDGLFVDDQYYAYIWPKNSDQVLHVEVSENVNIKVSNKSLDLKTFRDYARKIAKDNKASTIFYKINIKNNLIENIEQVVN